MCLFLAKTVKKSFIAPPPKKNTLKKNWGVTNDFYLLWMNLQSPWKIWEHKKKNLVDFEDADFVKWTNVNVQKGKHWLLERKFSQNRSKFMNPLKQMSLKKVSGVSRCEDLRIRHVQSLNASFHYQHEISDTGKVVKSLNVQKKFCAIF